MELINPKEITKAARLHHFGGENMAKILMSVFQLDKINRIYAKNYQKPAFEFLESILNELNVNYEVSTSDLAKIPKTGPFIIVANHPYGGLEGLILIHALVKIRPDIKVMSNYLLRRIDPIKDILIAVNPFEENLVVKQNLTGLRICKDHLENGKALVIFPAGEVSTYQQGSNTITDRKWNKSALKMIIKAKVPVVPVFFHGTNSALFHWLGFIHPFLRTAKIPSEMLNKRLKTLKMRIGSPIPVNEQELFIGISKFGRFLRAKTYALGSVTDVNSFYKPRRETKIHDIIPPVSKRLLCSDLLYLPDKYELFRYKNYTLYCAPALQIPNIMNEIGRLREITFREIGEGTNNSFDIDEYDLYYKQLFIWDEETKSIIGGYRAGLGKEIMEQFGIKGFYTRTLFKMDHKIKPLLHQSIELGRSFIVSEYQRKPMSLYLLWKGILYFLLKNNEYRYLIGPVSISDRFTNISQQLIVDFIQNNYFHQELSQLIQPRKAFIPNLNKIETDILTEEITNLNHLELLIKDIETPNIRIPVLLKKYLLMGGKIANFNVDPAFNNSLDGFLILDLANIPKEIIQSLSKEINDENINNRFVY
jgi:putative hemolysin